MIQAKLKKIKQKYADQDDNERSLRMSLLCVGIGIDRVMVVYILIIS